MHKSIHVAYHDGHETPLEVALEYADSVVAPGITPVEGTEDGNSIQLSNGKFLIFDRISVERLPKGVAVLEIYEWADDSVVPTPTTELKPSSLLLIVEAEGREHVLVDFREYLGVEADYKTLVKEPGQDW